MPDSDERESGMNQDMRAFMFRNFKRMLLLLNKSNVTIGLSRRNDELIIIQFNSIQYLCIKVLAQ